MEGEIHDLLKPLSWLIGLWNCEEGKGIFPNIQPFTYKETLEFEVCGKQPVIAYTAKSTHPANGNLMHLERGYLRGKGNDKFSFMVAHNFGLTTIEEGTFDGKILAFKSTNVGRMENPIGSAVLGTERDFVLSDGDLIQKMRIATEKSQMADHLSATYKKIEICPIVTTPKNEVKEKREKPQRSICRFLSFRPKSRRLKDDENDLENFKPQENLETVESHENRTNTNNNDVKEKPVAEEELKDNDGETDFDDNEENIPMDHKKIEISPIVTTRKKAVKKREEPTSSIRRSLRILSKPKSRRSKDDDIDLENSNSIIMLNKMKSKEFPTADITCDICLKKFFTEEHIRDHMKSEHEGSNFKCRNCSLEFTSFPKLSKHRKVHTSKYFCSKCSFSTKTEYLLKKHSDKHDEPPRTPVQFTCPECGKNFGRKSYLAKHVADIHREKKFECPTCQKRFASKRDLMEHAVSHIREEIELRVKPWECHVCSKRFEKEVALTRHISFMHADSRPFICKYRDCGRSYVRMEFLRNHEIVHKENKDYLCYTCGKSFKRQYSLYLHAFTHRPESDLPYGCHTCGRRYLRKTRLLAHQIRLGHKRDDMPDEIQNLVLEKGTGASKPREPREKIVKENDDPKEDKEKKPRKKKTAKVEESVEVESVEVESVEEIQHAIYEQVIDFAEFVVLEDPGIHFTIP